MPHVTCPSPGPSVSSKAVHLPPHTPVNAKSRLKVITTASLGFDDVEHLPEPSFNDTPINTRVVPPIPSNGNTVIEKSNYLEPKKMGLVSSSYPSSSSSAAKPDPHLSHVMIPSTSKVTSQATAPATTSTTGAKLEAVRIGALKMPLPPVSQLGLRASSAASCKPNMALSGSYGVSKQPITTMTTTTTTKKKIIATASDGLPAPLQPASSDRLNQLQGRSSTHHPSNSAAAAAAAAVVKPSNKLPLQVGNVKNNVATNKNGMKRPSTTAPAPVQKQPFASQRSVVPPLRTMPQAPLLHTSMRAHRGLTAIANKQQQQQVEQLQVKTSAPAGKENVSSSSQHLRSLAPAGSKPAVPAASKRTEILKRPLTIAVTPELMKRRRAKLKDEPRLTTEQLRAIEAERIRREFFQELHKKNANRGLAPRANFSHHLHATKVAPRPTHWR